MARPASVGSRDVTSSLTPVQQAVAITGAVALFILVIWLIYRGRLREDYGAVWLVLAAIVVCLAVWQEGLRLLARAFDAVTLTAPVFLLALAFLTALALHFSIRLSDHDRQLRIIAQTIGVIEADRSDGPREEPGIDPTPRRPEEH